MRSQTVRNEVLEKDGYRCQITGFNGEDLEERGQLETHHIAPLGMGGSQERDTVDNCITLHGRVHRLITDGKLHIEKFDRENKILEISDETFHVITRDSKALKKLLGITALYFHNRELFDVLSEAQERVARKVREEREDARDLWSLRLNDSFGLMDPTARSFSDYALGQGWSPNRASRFASLWECSESGDIKWMAGESATDYSRRLKAAGVVKPQTYWYAVLSLGQNRYRLIRTQEVDKLREGLNDGEALVRLGKFESGLRFKIDEGLTNWKGEPVKYDVL